LLYLFVGAASFTDVGGAHCAADKEPTDDCFKTSSTARVPGLLCCLLRS